ncbi:MAG: hypothetical protein AAF208_08300 [Cyanobacteria bacterium P01_A01_bin.45]
MLADTQKKFSWFQVPEDVKQLLLLAAENWGNPLESEIYINQALEKTENNIDVLISIYRYFYYKSNNPMALQTISKVLDVIKKTEDFPDDWEKQKLILESRRNERKIRVYLSSLAAYGLVSAKLGNIEEAKTIFARVKQLDENDEFSSGVLLDIVTRPHDEDEDY